MAALRNGGPKSCVVRRTSRVILTEKNYSFRKENLTVELHAVFFGLKVHPAKKTLHTVRQLNIFYQNEYFLSVRNQNYNSLATTLSQRRENERRTVELFVKYFTENVSRSGELCSADGIRFQSVTRLPLTLDLAASVNSYSQNPRSTRSLLYRKRQQNQHAIVVVSSILRHCFVSDQTVYS